MKINKKLIPIKIHYFLLFGSASTVIPFLMVISVQLGIPVAIAGTFNATSLFMVLFVKPVMATLADTFPSFRRTIFLLNLTVSMVFLVSIYFVPSMQEIPKLQGQLVRVTKHNVNSSDFPYLFSGRNLQERIENNDDKCHLAAASECMAMCSECSINTQRFNLVGLTPTEEENDIWEIFPMNISYSFKKGPSEEVIQHYWLEGLRSSEEWKNISIECARPEYVGPSCPGVLGRWEFWIFAVVLIVANITTATVLSFTDAIIIDTIGSDGNYGAQRAWGTIGWGVIAPISGALVDWWSGSSLEKDLAPAFLICFVLCFSDVLLSAAFIKVPEIKSNKPVFEEVLPLLRQPHFFVFCIFVLINGAFDGFCVFFLLFMQEGMAKGTSDMTNLRFMQGLTLFVQCSLEAPLMFVNHWFMRKFGAQRVISLVFLMYTIRLFSLWAAGTWGPVWSTIVVELLNGPCYGLGFTAVVVHSSSLSPAGTNTTVQTLVSVIYECVGYALSLFLGGLMCDSFGCPTMFLWLGIFAVVVFILQVVSLWLIPSVGSGGKTKRVTVDQGVKEDTKMEKKLQTLEIKQTVNIKDDILEETHL